MSESYAQQAEAEMWAEIAANEPAANEVTPTETTPCSDDANGCPNSGIYYGAGAVVNGVFKGFTGKCFRCGGKGHQTAADRKRNAYYDNHVRRYSL